MLVHVSLLTHSIRSLIQNSRLNEPTLVVHQHNYRIKEYELKTYMYVQPYGRNINIIYFYEYGCLKSITRLLLAFWKPDLTVLMFLVEISGDKI